MKKLNIIFFSVLLSITQLPLSGQQNTQQVSTKQLTLEEIKEDFQILRGALTTDYPSADRYISEDSVNALWSMWEKKLSPMNERHFFKLIGEITHSFHDEHLIPNISQSFLKNPNRCFLPFTVMIEDDEMWASVMHKNVESLTRGDKILSINGHKTHDIIREIRGKMHHDGYISTFIERHMEDFSPTQSYNFFDMWYSLMYEDSVSHFNLVVVNETDTTELEVESLLRKDYLEFYWSRMPREAPAKFDILNDSVGYLEISSFHGWYRKKHEQKFEKYFDQTFRTIGEQGLTALILDFRRCEGGDDTNKLLLQYLIDQPFTVISDMFVTFSGQPKFIEYYDNPSLKIDPKLVKKISDNWYGISEPARKKIAGLTQISPKKDAFKGKLYVLTSGATGSAAAVASAMLKNYTNATFIGEETGGTIDGPTALIVPSLTLPNSQIRVEVPFVQIHLNTKGKHGRGVIPDVERASREYSGDKLINEVVKMIEK